MVLGINRNKDKNTNTLNQSVTINGNIEFDGELIVDCLVNGNITTKLLDKSESLLIVKKNALIKGNISVNVIKFNGHIKGEITGKDITLQSKAQVKGGVNYEIVQIDEGAEINGSLNKKAKIMMTNNASMNNTQNNKTNTNNNIAPHNENRSKIEQNKKAR